MKGIKKFFTNMFKSAGGGKESPELERDLFARKYESFKALLDANNLVLELMADMEEKLSGEFLFDKHYLVDSTANLSSQIKTIVDRLNELSGNRYMVLCQRFDAIKSKIDNVISKKRDRPDGALAGGTEKASGSAYIQFYDDVNKEMVNSVGGKNSTLGEMRSRAKMPVPDGFAITADAYHRFMEHNGLVVKINERLSALAIDDLEALKKVSREIQQEIVNAAIPEDLETGITSALHRLSSRLPAGTRFSVRSSAIEEDSEFSFAGQYNSFLNVSPVEVPGK